MKTYIVALSIVIVAVLLSYVGISYYFLTKENASKISTPLIEKTPVSTINNSDPLPTLDLTKYLTEEWKMTEFVDGTNLYPTSWNFFYIDSDSHHTEWLSPYTEPRPKSDTDSSVFITSYVLKDCPEQKPNCDLWMESVKIPSIEMKDSIQKQNPDYTVIDTSKNISFDIIHNKYLLFSKNSVATIDFRNISTETESGQQFIKKMLLGIKLK